jgi:hypothetical protein
MKITRAGLRGMITEALQEMSMMGGPEAGTVPMEPGSAEEAGEQLLAIGRQLEELNKAALALVGVWGDDSAYERARLYWYGQISSALGSRAFLSRSMHSLRDSANDLMGAADEAGYREEEELYEARGPLSPRFHAAKRRMGGYPSLSAEELEGAELPTMPLTRRMGRGEPTGPVDWNDFAPYGMDQVGAAFVEAGGDAAAALRILQAGSAAAAEDEDF